MTDSIDRSIVKPHPVKKNSDNISKALQRPVQGKPGQNRNNKLTPRPSAIQHSPKPLQDEPSNEIASPSLVLPGSYDDNKIPPPSVSSSHYEGKTNKLIPVVVPLPADKINDDKQEPPPSVSSSSPENKVASLYLPRKLGCTLEDVKALDKNLEYIAGLYPRAMLTLLIGGAGVGKSSIAQGGMISITDAKRFLNTDNYLPINTGCVVVIDTEGRIEIFKQRVEACNATLIKYIIPGEDPTKLFSFQSKEDLKLIEDCIKEYHPDALIVDSFALFSTVDENTSAVLPCLKWMKGMALRYNLAAITTQLVNKSDLKGGRLTKDSVRGFSGLNQVPEVIYAIDIHPENSNFMRLYQVKNTLAQKDDNDYFFYIGDIGVVFVEEVPTSGSAIFSNRQRILSENKDKTNSDLAKVLQDAEPNLTWDSALKAVQRFRKDDERRRQGGTQD